MRRSPGRDEDRAGGRRSSWCGDEWCRTRTERGGIDVNGSSRWTGWVGFAAWLMIMIGALYATQGLIAIIRDKYYVVSGNQVIIFDVTTWGWVSLIWGILVGLAGYGLVQGANWSRWLAIVVGSVSVLIQLAFLGSAPYPVWSLAVITFCVIVLYVLLVRWDDVRGTV